MKLTIPIVVEAPDGATHYFGDLFEGDSLSFYKMTEIGVVGEHWFSWRNDEWQFLSHREPLWIKPIPEEWKV